MTIAYRRGEAAMPAFAYEYELARADGVRFEWFVQPRRVVRNNGVARGVEFVRTASADPTSRQSPVRTVARTFAVSLRRSSTASGARTMAKGILARL